MDAPRPGVGLTIDDFRESQSVKDHAEKVAKDKETTRWPCTEPIRAPPLTQPLTKLAGVDPGVADMGDRTANIVDTCAIEKLARPERILDVSWACD